MSERDRKIQSLIEDLGSRSFAARVRAREALTGMGRPAGAALAKALSDRRSLVRWEAAKALTKVVEPAAAVALVRAMEDSDSGVRWLAAEALIALGRDAMPPLLRALAKRPPSMRLWDGAHHVLHDGPGRALAGDILDAMMSFDAEEAVPIAAAETLSQLRDGR